MGEEKKSYPTIPNKSWWTLRGRLKSAATAKATPGFIATALEVSESRARLLATQFETLGIINPDGSLTDLGHDWRADDTYPAACGTISANLYPEELRDALPGPKPDRRSVERWFARAAGVGDEAARQMAQLYRLLAEADPKGAEAQEESSRTTNSGSTPQAKTKAKSVPRVLPARRPDRKAASSGEAERPALPSLTVAVQVYIPSEATPEQIDSIFASMARHLRAS